MNTSELEAYITSTRSVAYKTEQQLERLQAQLDRLEKQVDRIEDRLLEHGVMIRLVDARSLASIERELGIREQLHPEFKDQKERVSTTRAKKG